jgi:hypothetical protein
LTKLITDNRAIQDNILKLLTNQTVETVQLEEAIKLIKKSSIQIESECSELSKMVFNIKYSQNDQTIERDSIGDIFRVEKYENLNLDQDPNTLIFDCSVGSDGEFLFVFFDYLIHYTFPSNGIHVYKNYPQFKFIAGVDVPKKIDCYYSFNEFIIFKTINEFVIFKNDPITKKFQFHLSKILSDNMKYLTMCADADYIFVTDEQQKFTCLNWSLEEVKVVQPSENEVEHEIENEDEDEDGHHHEHEVEAPVFKNINQMDIRNKKFYLRKCHQIDIVDEKEGTLIKTINVVYDKFVIDDDKGHIVTFSSNYIKRFQLESGVLVSRIDIRSSIPYGYQLFDYKNDKYILKLKRSIFH